MVEVRQNFTGPCTMVFLTFGTTGFLCGISPGPLWIILPQAPISRSCRAQTRSCCAHITLVLRDMSVSAIISRLSCSYCAHIALIMRSYTAHTARGVQYTRNERKTRSFCANFLKLRSRRSCHLRSFCTHIALIFSRYKRVMSATSINERKISRFCAHFALILHSSRIMSAIGA